MQRLYWATTYFVIGYAIIVATMTALYQLPSSLKASIGMVIASILFVDLAYRYFKRTGEAGKAVSRISVIKVMALWALLSVGLDILLLAIITPLVATGELNLTFFSQQSSLYWAQFPMFFVFGFVAQAMYNRVMAIQSTRTKQLQ